MKSSSANKPLFFGLYILTLVIITDLVGMIYILDLSFVDSAFYTITTLATVGFQAPPNLTTVGKWFMVWVIISGFSIMGYVLGQLTQSLVTNRLIHTLGQRRKKNLKNLENHWVICGVGLVGKQVGTNFMRDKVPFLAIENDIDKGTALIEDGWSIIIGDAREESVLAEAHIDKAKGIIIALDDDANSVYVTLNARVMNSKLQIIARGNSVQATGMLYRAGANKVINPALSGANAMAAVATKPQVAEFLHGLDYAAEKLNLEFDSIRIDSSSTFCGKKISETNIRSEYGALILAVLSRETGEPEYGPHGDFVLHAGDEILVLVQRQNSKRLRETAGSSHG